MPERRIVDAGNVEITTRYGVHLNLKRGQRPGFIYYPLQENPIKTIGGLRLEKNLFEILPGIPIRQLTEDVDFSSGKPLFYDITSLFFGSTDFTTIGGEYFEGHLKSLAYFGLPGLAPDPSLHRQAFVLKPEQVTSATIQRLRNEFGKRT